MPEVKILAFAGSLRKDSYNKKLAKVALKGAQAAGAQVTFVDLRDLDLPVYDGDLEDEIGLPEGARRLKSLLDSHDGFLISSPEYNSSVSAALKNAIDWVSRPQSGEKPLQQFSGKVATLLSASPGGLGGLRGLLALRSILGSIGVIVLPTQLAISHSHEAFGQDGSLKDAKKQQQVEGLGRELAEFIAKLKR